MARTAQNIIDQVKSNRYPWATQTEALQYVNDTHKEIISLMPITCRHAFATPVTIATVIGQREYALPATINQIERVEQTISGTTTHLNSTSIENINRGLVDGDVNDIWINAGNGVPLEFYTSMHSDALYIGLNPIPSAIGSLKIMGSLGATLVNTDTILPIFSDEIYIEGLCYRLAKAKRRTNEAVAYYTVYQSMLKQLVNWFTTFSEDYQDKGKLNARIEPLVG